MIACGDCRRLRALLERFSETTRKAGVRLGVVVDEVQADDRTSSPRSQLSPLRISSTWRDHVGVRADRGAVRQLHHDEEGALVVFGQEAGRRDASPRRRCRHRKPPTSDEADDADAHQPRDDRAVAVADPVDAAHHMADRSASRPVMRLQQDGAERGRQVSALIADSNMATATVTANWRNSSPEMPGMKATGTKTDEQHQGDRDDRRHDLAHRASSSLRRARARDAPPSCVRRSRPRRSRRPPRCRSRAPWRAATPYWRSSRWRCSTTKVPIRLTGTAIIGISVARKLPRNRNTTSTTRRRPRPGSAAPLGSSR